MSFLLGMRSQVDSRSRVQQLVDDLTQRMVACEAKITPLEAAKTAAEAGITLLEETLDKRITTLEEKVDSLTPMVASLDEANKMVIATQNGVATAILTDHDNLHYDNAILKRTTNLTSLSQDKILSADAHRHDRLEQLESDIRSLSLAGRHAYATTKALTVHVGDSSGCTERGVEEHGKGADGVGWKSVRLSCWETSHMKGIIRVKHSSLSATKKRVESSPPPVVLANICSSRQDAFWAVFAPVKSWRSVGRGLR